MAFATAHGITLPIARNEWRLRPLVVGADDERADDGTLLTTETERKREWTSSLTPGVESDRERVRRLIEGHGLAVDFADASAFSWSGIGPKTANGVASATGGPRATTGRWSITSGGVLEYALANKMRQPGRAWKPTDGWTIVVFKKTSVGDGGDGVTFVDHIATGAVAVARGAAANPAGVTQYRGGVLGSWSMGRWIDVANDGDVGVWGYSNANAASTYDYAELVALPFTIPQTWAEQLSTYRAARAVSRLPRIGLGGDCITDDVLEVRCRVTQMQGEQMMIDGVWQTTARRDDVMIREA